MEELKAYYYGKLTQAHEVAQKRTRHLRPVVQLAYDARRGPDTRCGVYILFLNRKPVYVGMAKCIIRRIAQHIGKIKFDEYGVIECDYYGLEKLEYDVITLLAPPLNKRGGDRENGVLRNVKPVSFLKKGPRTPRKNGPDQYHSQGNAGEPRG